MANFYSYVILIVGMSLLFSIAGVQTSMNHFLGTYATVIPQSPTQNFNVSVTQFQLNGVSGSTWLIALYGVLASFVLVTGVRTIAGGTFGIAETVKVTVALAVLALMVADAVALITYLNAIPDWGGIIKIAAIVIYLPLTAGMIFSALDWIGGGK